MKTTGCGARVDFSPANLRNALGLTLLGAMIAGCSGGKPEKIVMLGSNTIGEELAPRLAAEYKKQHPGAAFEFEFKGTTYGMGALMACRCDIAAASREASTNEIALARERGVEFADHVIGAYDVAVIVNASNPLANLTKDQVRDLFTGVAQNWKDIGGPDAPVGRYVRDPISGTYLGFRELAMENKPYALNVKTYTNYAQIVQVLAQDPHGIGYTTLALATKGGVKPVAIDGVAPTAEAVNKGKYPYARVLRLYTDKTKETPATQEFLQFVQSKQGQQILDQLGYTPRP
jgi:phosphate transport system substrate-binding protein